MMLAVLLAAALTLTEGDASAVREASIRAGVGASTDASYFRAYCLLVSPRVGSALSEAERFRVQGLAEPDPSSELLARLRDLPHRVVPGSACKKTDGDYDVVEAATGRGPAIFMAFGPIEVLGAGHVRITEFTTSGFLTETVSELELRQQVDGSWRVVWQKILLQA